MNEKLRCHSIWVRFLDDTHSRAFSVEEDRAHCVTLTSGHFRIGVATRGVHNYRRIPIPGLIGQSGLHPSTDCGIVASILGLF